MTSLERGTVAGESQAVHQRHLEATEPYRQQLEFLARVFDAARSRGEIRDVDPARLAVAIFAITRGLITQRLLGRTIDDSRHDADFAVDLI